MGPSRNMSVAKDVVRWLSPFTEHHRSKTFIDLATTTIFFELPQTLLPTRSTSMLTRYRCLRCLMSINRPTAPTAPPATALFFQIGRSVSPRPHDASTAHQPVGSFFQVTRSA